MGDHALDVVTLPYVSYCPLSHQLVDLMNDHDVFCLEESYHEQH
jgi:hypothetical protein